MQPLCSLHHSLTIHYYCRSEHWWIGTHSRSASREARGGSRLILLCPLCQPGLQEAARPQWNTRSLPHIYIIFWTKSVISCNLPFNGIFSEVIMDDGIPVCDACEAVVKPDIVMFGEPLPQNFFKLSSKVCAFVSFITRHGCRRY